MRGVRIKFPLMLPLVLVSGKLLILGQITPRDDVLLANVNEELKKTMLGLRDGDGIGGSLEWNPLRRSGAADDLYEGRCGEQ